MTAVAQTKIYIQRDWTDAALLADGFLSYRPVKQVTMVRMLPLEEAPKSMKTSANTIITAQAGYWIAYAAGETLKATLDDYNPRPIEPDIFADSYCPWEEGDWQPTPTEAHLQRLGCQPYCKIASVWAKQLTAETWIQGMESTEPALAPSGAWLCVGIEGEPWAIKTKWFEDHYLLPGRKNSTI